MLSTPQQAKFEIFSHGLSVHSTANDLLHDLWNDRPLSLVDYTTTSGLTIRLENDVWINSPLSSYNKNFVKSPKWELVVSNGHFYIESSSAQLKAEPISVPQYYNKKNQWGEPYIKYIKTHADRARISPIEGCSYSCHFCNSSYKNKYKKKKIEFMIDAINMALHDPWLPARHLLISGGTPFLKDYGYLQEVYCAVPKKFPDLEVDVMMVPTPGLLQFEELKNGGIKGISINMEIYNDDVAKKIMPQKALETREGFLGHLHHAVKIFSQGKVRSLLLVGLEPIEDTLKGVEALARIGVDPVLSAFRPDPNTPLGNYPPPSVEFQKNVYLRSLEIVCKYPGVKLGPRCKPCQHNAIAF